MGGCSVPCRERPEGKGHDGGGDMEKESGGSIREGCGGFDQFNGAHRREMKTERRVGEQLRGTGHT